MRDDQVGVEHGRRKREILQLAATAALDTLAALAVVEVDEPQLLVAQRLVHARLDQRHLGVADVAGPFADGDLRAPAAKHLGGGQHDIGVRGDLRRGGVGSTRFGFSSTFRPRTQSLSKPTASNPAAIVSAKGPS